MHGQCCGIKNEMCGQQTLKNDNGTHFNERNISKNKNKLENDNHDKSQQPTVNATGKTPQHNKTIPKQSA